jgi:hypothetical protein
MTDTAAKLARARDYPYPYPGRSYTWRSGRVDAFDRNEIRDRTAVLAVGSNRAPDQLSRKYFGKTDSPIPVEHVRLRDFDIVYAAHLTRYGAVPAMLQHAPGTIVETAVTWLDGAQLEIMHLTEGGYHYAAIEDIDLTFDDGEEARSVHLYVGREGHLVHDDAPVPLAEIAAERRIQPARSTAEVLNLVRRRVAPETDGESFILRLIDDETYRRGHTARIAADAVPFGYGYELKA